MSTSIPLKYEISQEAQKLGDSLGISWELDKDYMYQPYFNLRAAIQDSILLYPGDIYSVATGIYPQMQHPSDCLEVVSLGDLAVYKQVVVLGTPMVFDYSFTNEINILLHKVGGEPFKIFPGEIIAGLRVVSVRDVILDKVSAVEAKSYSFGSQKWIQKQKNKIKQQKEAQEFSRLDVEKLKK